MKQVTDRGNLIDLEAFSSATMPIILIELDQQEVSHRLGEIFQKGFDSLDYLDFTQIKLDNDSEINLVQHEGSPNSGLLICIDPSSFCLGEQIAEVFSVLRIDSSVVKWTHPDFQNIFLCGIASELTELKSFHSEIEVFDSCLSAEPNCKLKADILKTKAVYLFQQAECSSSITNKLDLVNQSIHSYESAERYLERESEIKQLNNRIAVFISKRQELENILTENLTVKVKTQG